MTVRTILKSALSRKIGTVLFLAAMTFGGCNIAAHAQEAPDEAAKVRALKRAYEINGNSMVGTGMIDLTKDQTAADPVPQHPAAAAKVALPRRRP